MLSLAESYNRANISLGLIEYELNSLRGANYISVHIRFDLERYLVNIINFRLLFESEIAPFLNEVWGRVRSMRISKKSPLPASP